jgi:ABC-type glycerol-3-phosphate transport system substrate-binding protein
VLAAAACVAAPVALAACSSGGSSASSNSKTGTVTVAVVSNPLITSQMVPLTKSVFEKQHPGITVKFATYTEGDLRAAIEKNVSTHSCRTPSPTGGHRTSRPACSLWTR